MATQKAAEKAGSSSSGNGPSEKLGVAKHTRSRRRGPVQQRQYVAIDLHRWRSVIVREDKEGGELGVTRIDNSALALRQAISEAGPCPQVAIEATAGWYRAVDVLEELGAEVHLVNPSGLAWGDRRVKNATGTAATSSSGCAWASSRRPGSPRRRLGSCGSWCASVTS